jgi:hypothetical protein
MSIKDSVAGTAKQLLGEIMGDGKLAAEGARQTAAGPTTPPEEAGRMPPQAMHVPPRVEPTAQLGASSGE